MKKKLTVTIKLTRKELEEILRDKLALPTDAVFNFNLGWAGDQRDEYQVFAGLDITSSQEVEI